MSVAKKDMAIITEAPAILYSISDEKLLRLVAESKELNSAATPNEYKAIAKAIRPLVSARTTIESERKKKKAGVLELGRKIDGEAKRITAIITDEETRLKAIKQHADDEAARIEAERIAALKARIDAIARYTAEQIEAVDIDAEFPDKREDAQYAVARRAHELKMEAEAAEERERMERERAELEAQRKEMAEAQAKIDAENAEKQRAIDEENVRIAAERKKVEDERHAIEAEKQRKKMEAEAKERAENELKARLQREAEEKAAREKAEAEAAAERERLRPDVEKATDYLQSLVSKPVPDIADEYLRENIIGFHNSLKTRINVIIAGLDS